MTLENERNESVVSDSTTRCPEAAGPGKAFRKQVALLMDLLYTKLWVKRRTPEVVHDGMTRCATSFFVRAIK